MDGEEGVYIEMVDDPSLAAFHEQMRHLWYVDQYLPVVALGIVAAANLGSGLGVALTALVPPVIWLVVEWVRVTFRRRAGLEERGVWPSRIRSIIGGQFLWCEIAVFICMTGVWAAATVFPVAVICVVGAKVRGMVPVDVARLPVRVRELIDATPGLVQTLAVPGRPGCPPVVGRGDALYITRGALQSDEAALSGEVAREVAHVRLGHRRTSVASTLHMTVVIAAAWLVAVSLGPLPFSYQLPLSGLSPAWLGVPWAAFGLAVAFQLAAPVMYRRSRLREDAADALVVQLLGDGIAFARDVATQVRTTGEPLWPPRWFVDLAYQAPPAGERLQRGVAYGQRTATPSLTPAGAWTLGVIDRHRHVVLVGGWAWVIALAWILAKLHPGGTIH
jgi:Zn-dependent protease with chaperone function